MKVQMLAAVTAMLFVAADTKDNDAKKELEKLQGTWYMAALEVEGQQVAEEKLQSAKLTIKGDKYTVTVKDTNHETVITLDPTKKPKTIDMVFTDGPNKDKIHRGIYELDGDTFKLCRAREPDDERPTEFASQPKSGIFVVTWKRQTK